MRKLYPLFNKNIASSFFRKTTFFRGVCFLFILFFIAGWNTNAYSQPIGWEYSRNIAIIGGTGTPVADYQIKITLTAGEYTNMKADGSDLRFYVGATPCNFWVESWNTSGQSVIWVKVPVAGTSSITMYYGNPTAATAASPGTDVFDFFDDFNTTPDPGVWDYTGTQSGSVVTLHQGDYLTNKNPFPIATGSSFFLETKHNEGSYWRVRYYATTSTGNNQSFNYNSSMIGVNQDYGYFSDAAVTDDPTATVFWNNTGFGVNPIVTAGNDYITQWQITDNGSFRWTTLNSDYSSFGASYTSSPAVLFRYITIGVTEGTASTSVDWVRVRKSAGGGADPVSTVGAQVQLPPTITGFTQPLLCAGDVVTVTITGDNFDNTSSVTFNGVEAVHPLTISRTQIIATSQLGVTAGPIIVTTPGGSATSASNLVVNPLPNSFNVSGGGHYCQGGAGMSIILDGSESGVSYQLFQDATAVGSPFVGNGSPYTFPNQTANAAYTVVATIPSTGCKQTMTGAPTVVIDPLPTAYNVTVTNGGSFCSGGPGVSVGLDNSTSGISYQLYRDGTAVGAPIPGVTGNAISFGNQTIAGSYTVTAVAPTGCTNAMTGSVTVSVNPLPTGTINVTENSGTTPNDGKICVGDQITFTAPAGYTSYTFKVDGASVGTQPTPNIYSTSSLIVGTRVVTVDVIDANGCHGTFNTSVPVSVSALPTGSFAPSVNNVCPGIPVTFNAPTGYANYVFKVNGGSPVNTFGISSYSYTTLVNGDIVSVDVTNSNGCMKTFTATKMIIKPLPAAAGTITGTAQLCAGSTNVTYTVPAITNATSYAWTLPTGASFVGDPTGSSITVNFSNAATTGNITVAGVNGCGNGTLSTPFQVIVNPLPTLQITNPAAVCSPSTVDLTAASVTSSSTAGLTFTYFKDAAGTVSLPSPNAVAVSGAYYIKGTTAKGCFDVIKPVVVTINALPTLQIHNPAAVCSPGTVDLTAASVTSGSTTGLTFTYFTDAAGTNALSSPNAVATSGTYYIKGASAAGCSDAIKPVVVTINPLPTATITYSTTPDNPIECLNSITKPVVTFTGSGGTLPYKFTYLDGAGQPQTVSTTSTNSSVTINVPTNLAGAFTYTLTGVSDNSSTQCFNPQPGSVTVTIKSLPVITLSGKSPICQTDVHELYTTESGMENYTWIFTGGNKESGGGSSENSLQMLDWAIPGAKSISVNYTDPATGCRAAAPATVNVTGATTVPDLNGSSFEVCQNGTATYTTQAVSGYTEYIWTVPAGSTITSGQGTSSITVDWGTSGDQLISVNFSNDQGCTASSPTQKTVKVNPTTVAGTLSADQTICSGATPASITLSGNIGNIVKWQKADDIGFTTNVSDLANTTTTLTGGQMGALTSTTYYRAVVLSGNCLSENTIPATVTVSPVTVAGTASGDQTICANTAPMDLSISGSTGAVVMWQSATNAIFTAGIQNISVSADVLPGATIGALTATKYFRAVIKSGVCSSVNSDVITVNVDPVSKAGAVSVDQTICTGTAPADITISGNTGNVIKWQSASNAAFTNDVTDIPSSASNTLQGSTIGNLTIPTYFRAVVVSGVCSSDNSLPVTVNISPVSVGGTLTGGNTVCTGSNSGTINLDADKVGNVTRWESSIDGGTTWNAVTPANTTSSLTYNNLAITTQYHAIVQSGTCAEVASNAVTITVNTANGGTVDHGPSGTGTVCAGTAGSVVLTGNSGTVLQWEYSTDGTNWLVDATKHDPFYNFPAVGLTQTTWYRALTQATPCTAVYSTVYKVTVNPHPGATITGSPASICIGGSATLTLNLTGSGGMSGTVTDGTTNYTFNGTSATPVTLTVTPASSTTYYFSTLKDANCTSDGTYLPTSTALITVNALPAPVVITPGNTTICSGTVLPLSSVENHAGNFIFNQITSTTNVAIPDNNLTGIGNTITVPANTIPVGGIVDSVFVTMNVQHPDVQDLGINLGAPNGKIITLVDYSLTGANLTGTTVSSRTHQYPVITTGTTPYTGTYSARGDDIYGAETGNANTRKFTDLFGTSLAPPNGDWTLYLTDDWAGNTGTLQGWTLKIYYHVPVNPVNIVWSPLDSLFNDPSATIPYTGDARQTVYAKPSATTTYTGRAEDVNSCTSASDVTITVTPAPDVTVTADYCSVPNKVKLTASSDPVASSYVWNTGGTTSSIAVDEAKLYTVAATTGLHCVATGFLSVAQELVKNGNFEAGNTRFYTEYGYVPPPGNQTGVGSLEPEGLYAVDTNAHNYHTNFFGKDHTTPAQTGKFMIINGNPNSDPRVIWQETVSVLPNTNYYYSAWAMNLNNVQPFATLQFSVNGVPIGTAATNGIADLSAAPKPGSTDDVNINNWVRFYYGNTNGWNSGSNTTAVIRIINLTPDANGNDFGLDDISFATLSTFITLTSAPGTDNQSVCRGDKITDITYSVGSGGTPTVTGLPHGLTYNFKNGITLTISGTPDDISGVYTYTITTTGSCSNPTTATGHITVKGQKVTLSSLPGNDAQIVCKGAPISPINYTLSEMATDAVVTGLPAGVTASPVSLGKVITITGSPTDSGTFTYKIKTIGGSCNADSLTGTIRSNVQTIEKTSGDDNQTLCINQDMGAIIYTLGGTATNANITGLPAGVSFTVNSGIATISGKPSIFGEFPYTITTAGSCNAAAITGKITVSPDATVSLSSPSGSDAQTICFDGSINTITYNTSGAPDAGITVTGLPAGVGYTVNSGIVTITGSPTVSGPFTYTVKAVGACVAATMNGTITIDALVNTGSSFTAIFTQLCSTPIGTLTLNGSSGTIKGWEYSTDAGTTWNATSPVTTTNVLNFSISGATYFRAVFDGGACGDSYSSPYNIGVHNLWTGKVSTDWNDINNWSDGSLPSTSCPDVIIPQAPSNNYPVLSYNTATITNLQIKSLASVTVNGTGKMQIGGDITNAGVFDATAATIDFNGTTAQNVAGSIFKNNTLQNLIVSNASTLAVDATTGDTLKISGSLTFGTNGKINTGNNITLLSTDSSTANVGELKTGNSITGSVTVERYVGGIYNWQFLAIPTQTSQTINQAWQEGQTPGIVGPIGYGTQITYPGGGPGMDFSSVNPSMKYWDVTSQAYKNITNTLLPFTDNSTSSPTTKEAFFLFIRGDRRATATANPAHPRVPTVMRTSGALNTGQIDFSIPGNSYYALGNPYASRVDFRKIANIGGIGSTFYVWDPLISGNFGAGGYQTFSDAGAYKPSVTTAYYDVLIADPYIESGQAVFVNNTGGTPVTLTFNESAKTTGSHLVFRGEAATPSQFLRTYLYTSSGKMADGITVAFNRKYQNRIDAYDAVKISNTGENLGLKRDGIVLAIEAHAPVSPGDTIYFNLKNMAKQTYRFQFSPENFGNDGLRAYLIDNYLKTKTEVSLGGVSSFDFTVNSDAASYAQDRFMVVFKQSSVLPISFTSLTASQKDKNIVVEWNVQNEQAMLQYDVEKSVDGINFVKKETVPAKNSGSAVYQWTDKDAEPGDNYYRIRSVDKNGRTVYSTVVKVIISVIKSSISIYPNPITDGIIHLQFVNQPQGRYGIRLLNPLGQLIVRKQIEFAGGNGSEGIKWDYNLAHGVYQLEIIKPDKNVEVIRVMY